VTLFASGGPLRVMSLQVYTSVTERVVFDSDVTEVLRAYSPASQSSDSPRCALEATLEKYPSHMPRKNKTSEDAAEDLIQIIRSYLK
jgi:hypothetical protein